MSTQKMSIEGKILTGAEHVYCNCFISTSAIETFKYVFITHTHNDTLYHYYIIYNNGLNNIASNIDTLINTYTLLIFMQLKVNNTLLLFFYKYNLLCVLCQYDISRIYPYLFVNNT